MSKPRGPEELGFSIPQMHKLKELEGMTKPGAEDGLIFSIIARFACGSKSPVFKLDQQGMEKLCGLVGHWVIYGYYQDSSRVIFSKMPDNLRGLNQGEM